MKKLIIVPILALVFNGYANLVYKEGIAKNKMQLQLKQVVSNAEKEIQAKRIMVVIMNSLTGKIVYHIDSNHINALINNIANFSYQPGSIMKPITVALVLDKNLVKIDDKIDVNNGCYNIGKQVILDKKKFKTLSVENILIQSSNIGTVKLAQKLDAREFYDGLLKFGFSKRLIPSIKKLNHDVYKAITSYGYRMRANLIQLVKAYSLFDNAKNSTIIKKQTAKKIHNILIKSFKRQINKNGNFDGLIIGGELGTSYVIEHGRYVKKYNSTFIGFVNDSMNHKYTIGILVNKTKNTYSAISVFNKVLLKMLKNGQLKK